MPDSVPQIISKAGKGSPKLHSYFQHMCEWQCLEWRNPKGFDVYSDEDLVGQLLEVAESCHPATMPTTALFEWLTLVFSENTAEA